MASINIKSSFPLKEKKAYYVRMFDYTVTELCFCNGVENYVKSLNVNSQLQIEKLSKILPGLFYLFFIYLLY